MSELFVGRFAVALGTSSLGGPLGRVGVAPVGGAAQLYDAHRGVQYSKPRLRGWAHLLSFGICLVFGTLLIGAARGPRLTVIAAVYAGSLTGMFGASALYHRGSWGPRGASWLQRLDQLMIFVLIAGTATPPMALCLPGAYAPAALVILWSLTGVAAVARLVRMRAPEWLAVAIFLGLGWMAGVAIPAVWVSAGVAPAVLLIVGGALYTAGALAYHRRWPDPRPAVFGYHEVFHLFVCVAAACQYVAIAYFLF
jgi:hemolysin III